MGIPYIQVSGLTGQKIGRIVPAMNKDMQYMIDEGEHTIRRLRVAGLHEEADDLAGDIEALRMDGSIGLYRRNLAR